MRILITGICGFVGSTLAQHLRRNSTDIEIFGIDNLGRSGSWLNKPRLEELDIKVIHGDIRLASDLEVLPKADWVIDAAANASVLAGVDGKTSSLQLIQNNLLGTVNILEYCKKHQAGFILLSTSRVYSIPPLSNLKMTVVDEAYTPDRNQDFPTGLSVRGVAENYSVSAPISLYGCTKLNSEQLALEYGVTFNFPVWINRCGVMAGAGQFGHPGQGIFAYWIHSFKEKLPLKYVGFGGTGYQTRDCLQPKDLIPLLVQQMSEPLKSTKPRTLNLSGGTENSMSLSQLTRWCSSRYSGNKVHATDFQRPFDIPWMVLDNTLAKDIWNWTPQTSVHEVCEEIAAFADTQENWCKVSAS